MKFYREKKTSGYWQIIKSFKLNAIYISPYLVGFFKNGKYNNIKNAAYIRCTGYKGFWFKNEYYGDSFKFTKKSWRKFVKLQTFI